MEGMEELAFLRRSMVTDHCKLELPIVDAEKQMKTNKQTTPQHPHHLTIRDNVDIIALIIIKATMAISIFLHRDLWQ